MAPKSKRARKGTAAAAASAGGPPPPDAPHAAEPFLYTLGTRLATYDTPDAATLLHQLTSAKHPLIAYMLTGDTKKQDTAEPCGEYVYLVVLATHVLRQLTDTLVAAAAQAKAHRPTAAAAAVAASWLCHSMTTRSLLAPHALPKPERLTGAAARCVVGRCLLAVAAACTNALHCLTTTTSSDNDGNHDDGNVSEELRATCIAACIDCLDSVVVAGQSSASTAAAAAAATPQTTYWTQTKKALHIGFDEFDAKVMANLVDFDAGTWTVYANCYAELQTMMMESSSSKKANHGANSNPSSPNSASPNTSSTSSKRTRNAAASFQQIVDVCQDENNRLALKRWTGTALTWYQHGQEKLLQSALHLLLRQQQQQQPANSASTNTSDGSFADYFQQERSIVVQTPDKNSPAAATTTRSGSGSAGAAGKQKAAAAPVAATVVATTTTVPPNVTLLTLVCRLCRIVCEAGSAAGGRPPAAGGFCSFVKTLYGPKRKARADLRDVAMMVVYHLVQRHGACLQENFRVGKASPPWLVVNENVAEERRSGTLSDETSSDKASAASTALSSVESLFYYYPFVHAAIEEVASAVAANNGGGLPYSDRVEYAAAAFIVEAKCPVLDARLTNFCLSKLVSCLELAPPSGPDAAVSSGGVAVNSTSGGGGGGSSAPAKKKKDSGWKLDKPLTVPTLTVVAAPKSRKRKAAAKDTGTLFAGVYENTNKGNTSGAAAAAAMLNDEKLSLFIRAMRGDASALSSHLIQIVETCYDTRQTEDMWRLSSASHVATAAAGKKRSADPVAASSSRGGKRRKKNSKKKTQEPVAEQDEAVAPYKRLEGMRSTVATTALEALQLFLRDSKVFVDTNLSELQATLRGAVSMDQMNRLVNLGYLLDKIVVKPRETLASSCESVIPGVEDVSASFTPGENALWTAHMKMCINLGRGQTPYEPKKALVLDLMQICQKIAEQPKQLSPKPGWPLCLSPANRVLLSASLACEPLAEQQDATKFIVDGFIVELSFVMKNPSSLPVVAEPRQQFSASEEIPVSLYDARIFLAAFSGLSSEDQATSFSSLLSAVDDSISRMADYAYASSCIEENAEVPGLFARVITLCVNAYAMIRFGVHARDELLRVVGTSSTSFQPPALRPRSEWYYSSKCFMSVFGDWEDSELPPFEAAVNTVSKESERKMQRVLETALRVGIQIARTDRCHLVYAAWNALGKGDLWNVIPSKIQPLMSLPDDLSGLLIQLRDELCLVHRKIKRVQGTFFTVSTLLRAIDEKETAANTKATRSCPADVKVCLLAMVKKTTRLVDLLLQKFVPDDESIDQEIPPDVFCLLEACSIYLCFAVSSMTKPSSDLFTSTMQSISDRARNRARGYSTDSEVVHSEGASVDSQDVLVDTLERFQDVCECLGAVPSHPDWLDTNCRLLEGVSSSEAASVAHEAQACLTKLTAVGFAQFNLLQRRALKAALKKGQGDDAAALASKLCWLHHYEIDESVFGESPYDRHERIFGNDIGELCTIAPELLAVILAEQTAEKRHEPKGSWCPRSSQRVVGRLRGLFKDQYVSEVESPELRGSGEWEVLMAGTLSSACMHLGSDERINSLNDDVYYAIERSECWIGVCWSAIDCLVPTAALLRFGLSSGGRRSHPLSSLETNTDDFESDRSMIVQELPPDMCDISSADQIKGTIIFTLGALARFPPSPTCDAVATHLMVDAASFAKLQGMEANKNALQALADIDDSSRGRTEAMESALFLVERIASIIGKYAIDGGHDDEKKQWERPNWLYGCLRRESNMPSLRFNTIMSKEVDPSTTLGKAYSFCDTAGEKEFWTWEGSKDRYIQSLLSCVLRDSLISNVQTRGYFARLMSTLVAMEYQEGRERSAPVVDLLSPIVSAFNEVPNAAIEDIIQKDICGDSQADALSIQSSLCTLLAFLLSSCDSTCAVFERASLVGSTLEHNFDTWKEFDPNQRQGVLELTLLYASKNGKLFDVGGRLFKDLKSKQKSGVDDFRAFDNVKRFADFLVELSGALSKKSTSAGISALTVPSNFPPRPTRCSFATRKDFHEQHWYNCYTCGLTKDLGCCSFCALACHQGHDVEYSRHSSFFCDCGGEEVPAGSQPKCKCQSPQTRDKVEKKDRSEFAMFTDKRNTTLDGLVLSTSVCATIVKHSFPQDGQGSLNGLSEKGRSSAWIRFLFEKTKSKFESWKTQVSTVGVFSSAPSDLGCYGLLSKELEKAPAKTSVEKQPISAFAQLGVSRSGAFQTKIAADQRARLSRNGVVRSLMDADSRGRIVIAEPNSLVFCNALPVVNLPSSERPDDKVVPRSSMSIISSLPIGVKVVGLRFARSRECSLCAWGAYEAKAIFMNHSLSAIDFSATLEVGLAAAEEGSDMIVNSHWLCGSTCVLVGRRRSLLLFDVSGVDETVAPCLTISAGTCLSRIQDFAVFRCPHKKLGDRLEEVWKVYVLLENGTLHETTVTRDSEYGFSESEELDPTHTIHVMTNGATSDEPSTEPLFAKGSLTYLEQSNTLVYQSPSSPALSILLNEAGEVKRTFELLPFKISATVLEQADGNVVSGPYTHWTELGVARRGSTNLFRVSCAGRTSPAGEPVLLCLEFNESTSRVEELPKNATGWFDPNQSYEGCTALTAPFVLDDSNKSSITADKVFAERVVLCSLTLNGCLHIHLEEMGAPVRAALEPSRGVEPAHSEPSLDLLIFESLTNVTTHEDVVISADGCGDSESIKVKLLTDSDSYISSPRREGLTLHISMFSDGKASDVVGGSQYFAQSAAVDDLVVAAVRILVGSTSTECIPRAVKVMGRVYELAPGERRWYSFRLTAQELAFSIRSGFVSIELEACLDATSCPVIDSLEVYALERRMIDRWLPCSLQSVAASVALTHDAASKAAPTTDETRDSFRLSLMALASMHSLQDSFKLNRNEKALLKQLVQDTALEKDQKIDDAVDCLVSSLHNDEDSRQSFHDKAVLSGCSRFLARTLETFKKCDNDAEFHRLWQTLIPSLRTCFQTAARIARLRPFNYLPQGDETQQSYGSIAADASVIMNDYLTKSISNDALVSDFVELSLLETAVANGSPKGQFGSFDGLRRLLSSPSQAVMGQTCSAISRFCRGCDLFPTQTMAVKYVCDSCMQFINHTRYTLLDDDHTFDLCPNCYKLGQAYCSARERSGDMVVEIGGKTVGDASKLTCGEVTVMQAVSIPKGAAVDGPSKVADRAEREESETEGKQLFMDFMDGLFSGIAALLGDKLSEHGCTSSSLVWLSVDLVRHCFESGRKIKGAKRLAKSMAIALSSSLDAAVLDQELSGDCVALLEGLTSIFAPEQSCRDHLLGVETIAASAEVGTKAICAHGNPAVLRKLTLGSNQGRSFFACSKDARQRCSFFAWADAGDHGGSHQIVSLFKDDIAKIVWDLFSVPLQEGQKALHLKLCSFVETFANKMTERQEKSPNNVKRNSGPGSEEFQRDYGDGVLCSRGRLRGDASQEILISSWQRLGPKKADSSIASCGLAVSKSLDLISLIASSTTEDRAAWFPILCRIIATAKGIGAQSDRIRLLAKQSLRQLCGKNTGMSRAVRDHFSFAFQWEKLIECTADMLHYCVMLNEKARQCGDSWDTGEPTAFEGLSVGQIVGAEDLVSENVSTMCSNEEAGKILSAVWAAANKRKSSWRRFCGLSKLPAVRSIPSGTGSSTLALVPPLRLLLAVACTVSYENQSKALRLISLGMVNSSDQKAAPVAPVSDTGRKKGTEQLIDLQQMSTSEDEGENVCLDGKKASPPSLYSGSVTPEETIDFSIEDAQAFVLRFVCRGKSSEIRSLSSSIALRLCKRLDQRSVGTLFHILLGNPLCCAGVMGKRYTDFLTFLPPLLRLAGSKFVDVGSAATLVQSHLKEQLLAIRHDRANGEFMHIETRSSAGVQKKRFDLALCTSCRNHSREKNTEKIPAPSAGASSTARPSRPPKTKWLPEQVSPLVRGRLEAGRDSCTSNEFSSFFALEHRFILSAIHVEIDSPRRFVKTINFYFSPRPESDPNVLKADEYAPSWQPCGTMNLSRGASRGSLTLATPVTAAGLRIDYADFYERSSHAKSSDGTLVVHCPRCTRVVTNAHGVCANCGEVAFQCRKCRHINYDRLDAFLCVECGFCASASFQYEITAGVASNAIAITNDGDFEEASKMAAASARLHQDLKMALKQKLTSLLRGQKKNAVDEEDKWFGKAFLKRAFDGAPPLEPGETDADQDFSKLTLSQLGKQGSIVKMIASVDGDRSLSLFRSTRQLRSEAASTRADGILIRGVSYRDGDEEESASELLGGLLDSTGSLSRYAGLDPGDPLSRLLASVQSRRERREAEDREQEADAQQAALPATKEKAHNNAKETMEVCDRLYQLMREAERESDLLKHRCTAWRRLEKGSLAVAEDVKNNEFEPSHCSVCSTTIALHLLVLWLGIFQLEPDSVVITKETISILLNDDPTTHLKNLLDTKRAAVKEIALHSKQGGVLVLEALRLRLILMQDVNSAEILGKILETVGDTDAAAPFVALAREAMEANVG